MMGLIRDRRCHFDSEIREEQDSNSTVTSQYSFTKRQKGRTIQMKSKYTASESLLFLRRFIAVAMGIRFFVMMTMLVTIFIHFSNPKAPRNTDGFYCGPCPKNWICYKNICYLFSNESKSWIQSQASCLSHSSSLLKIYSKEDQDFLTLVEIYHWIGLIQSTPDGFWMWEDGSPLSPDLFSLVLMQRGNCAVYSSNFKGYTENCSNKNNYICMHKAIHSNFDYQNTWN
ncbi:NKG2-D type II integral membrane protein [Dromiciops gliroides]|uniref:NKG2-D type II integral membrane protein n=1 Tax=Dromiciops gliroides TaxID=33562 RepID=UPI001CC517B5|nr:NKG2-D type II integral membrane protein [Dromiciops gliroides]